MKVIITPHGGDSNPYQKLLAASLEALGLEIILGQADSWRGLFPLWRILSKYGRSDIIHLQWHHTYFKGSNAFWAILRTSLFFVQWFTLRLLGIRFVWTVHNIVNHEKYRAEWELKACRLLARLVDGLIVHCPAVVSTVAAAYKIKPTRIHVVPHGNYEGCYPAAVARHKAREALSLPDEARIFLFFGGIRAYKGVDRLLDIFAQITDPNLRLIIAGQPQPTELKQGLSAQAAADPRVITDFTFVPDERLITYLSACDLVVLPYQDSLTSGAAIMAATYGRPVVVPQLGCMGDLPATMALSYNPAQREGLATTMKQAVTAPLAEMGVAAKAYAAQNSWSVAGAKTLAVYQGILGKISVVSGASAKVDYEA